MFMPVELSLTTAIELASAVKDYLKDDDSDNSLGDKLCDALRTIYFVPDGVLRFLRNVAAGVPITPDQTSATLIEFNDGQWGVEKALEAIDFKRLRKELRLNLRTASALEAIRWGKLSLRRDIQNEINYYGQRGVKPDRARAAEFVVGIEKLNSSIEEVEMLVNKRAKR